MGEKDQRTVHNWLRRDDSIPRLIHFLMTKELLRHDEYRAAPYVPHGLPRHLDTFDHRIELPEKHGIQYLLHLQHKNPTHHKDLRMRDHLDSEMCVPH